MQLTDKNKLISIMVPLYNEEDVILSFYQRMKKVLDQIDCDSELLFVNDGSSDRSLEMIKQLASEDKRLSTLICRAISVRNGPWLPGLIMLLVMRS